MKHPFDAQAVQDPLFPYAQYPLQEGFLKCIIKDSMSKSYFLCRDRYTKKHMIAIMPNETSELF